MVARERRRGGGWSAVAWVVVGWRYRHWSGMSKIKFGRDEPARLSCCGCSASMMALAQSQTAREQKRPKRGDICRGKFTGGDAPPNVPAAQ